MCIMALPMLQKRNVLTLDRREETGTWSTWVDELCFKNIGLGIYGDPKHAVMVLKETG